MATSCCFLFFNLIPLLLAGSCCCPYTVLDVMLYYNVDMRQEKIKVDFAASWRITRFATCDMSTFDDNAVIVSTRKKIRFCFQILIWIIRIFSSNNSRCCPSWRCQLRSPDMIAMSGGSLTRHNDNKHDRTRWWWWTKHTSAKKKNKARLRLWPKPHTSSRLFFLSF